MPRSLIALCAYLEQRKGKVSGISFADATKIEVCHPKRVNRYQVFKEEAELGKSSMGWFSKASSKRPNPIKERALP